MRAFLILSAISALLTLRSNGDGRDLLSLEGVESVPGHRATAWVSDTGSISTNGAITSNGAAMPPVPVGWPTEYAFAYMIGADSDIEAAERQAVYVSNSRAPGLAHFMFADNYDIRLRIEQDGMLTWVDGDREYPLTFGPPDSCGVGLRCLAIPNE